MGHSPWRVEDEGVALGDHLRRRLELSHRRAQDLIRRGAVRVDGTVADSAGLRPPVGAEIAVTVDAPRRRPDDVPVPTVLHEDAHIVVVAKPPGLLTVPRDEDVDRPPGERVPSLIDWLRRRFQERGGRSTLRVVQRLDRGTSGVLVFARTRFAHEHLKPLFVRHEVERHYRAIVVGVPPEAAGRLAHRLVERGSRVIEAHPTEPGAKKAITHYTVVATAPTKEPTHALLDLRLETGRRNQIRIGCALSGFPVLGDPVYGTPCDTIDRPALHARTLAFPHPKTEERLEFVVEEPSDFRRAWSAAGGDEKDLGGTGEGSRGE